MTIKNLKTCRYCKSANVTPFLSCKDHFLTQEKFDLYQCQDCNLVFTMDLPGEKEMGRYYQSEEYISHSDTKKGFINRLYHVSRNFMLSRKRKLIERENNSNSKELLDIGSGSGYFLNHMKKHGWRVTGIEKDKGAREFSKQTFHLDVYNADHLFKLPEKQYSIVTLWHVLEHMRNPEKVMSNIHKILTDDGILILALPNYTSFDAKHYQSFWAAYDVPRHLWHFSPASVQKLSERSGFQIIRKKRMPLDAFYVSILSEKYKRNGKGHIVPGFFIGLISWIRSLFNINASSSIISILKLIR